MPNPRSLAQISQKIKALEKKTNLNVIEIGKLLEEAADQCEHGEFTNWLKTEFSWSGSTALNYRNVYALTQKRKIYDFAKLDISISALYLVARMRDDDPALDEILKAAQSGRVSYGMACDIATPKTNGGPAPDDEAEKPSKKDDEPFERFFERMKQSSRQHGKQKPKPKPFEEIDPLLRRLLNMLDSDNENERRNAADKIYGRLKQLKIKMTHIHMTIARRPIKPQQQEASDEQQTTTAN